jgi:hypothetical protein
VIQLALMNEEPLGPVRQALGLNFIIRYRPKTEVLEDRFLPVSVGVGWLGDSCYLQPGLSGLVNWHGWGPQVSI